ncbi:hypothetical protein AB9P05_08935 [Roseivirga sp. BDSF3-8]|uniref:hypothetical protein n=1 Tax=Roseivirga sp. BDSF3-8 TaxID=3241598 RepID=UPI0035324E04
MEQTQLLLALIKEDLKINAFISSMNQAGLLVESYSPHISDIIFNIAGVPSGDDAIYDMYWSFLDGLNYKEVCEQLDLLSTKFYTELVAFRRQQEHFRRRVRQYC